MHRGPNPLLESAPAVVTALTDSTTTPSIAKAAPSASPVALVDLRLPTFLPEILAAKTAASAALAAAAPPAPQVRSDVPPSDTAWAPQPRWTHADL
mmetsp:Transcript_23705/g.45568  ORF Transcript_23705/g.45568 Transcript_23705/m.45568 type:complete len:96 (-) Transcript_23705:1005-1292(-)